MTRFDLTVQLTCLLMTSCVHDSFRSIHECSPQRAVSIKRVSDSDSPMDCVGYYYTIINIGRLCFSAAESTLRRPAYLRSYLRQLRLSSAPVPAPIAVSFAHAGLAANELVSFSSFSLSTSALLAVP